MSDLVLQENVAGPRGERVMVRRSARRRRTVSISRRDGDLVIAIPATFSARRGDEALARMAREVSEAYLGGRAHPSSVTWSTRQNHRWGSCTPADGTIRLSHQLQDMPDYVVRSVMMHELVHLLVPGHGKEFQALMALYPQAQKAQGFLDGFSWARSLPSAELDGDLEHEPDQDSVRDPERRTQAQSE
ncbi:MAG: M48 metallopeptidase family protein [Brachybacterium tyrofermentans]